MKYLIPGLLGGLWGVFCSLAIGGIAGMCATVVGGFVLGIAYGIARQGKA